MTGPQQPRPPRTGPTTGTAAIPRGLLPRTNPLVLSAAGVLGLVASYAARSPLPAAVALVCYVVAVAAVAPGWRVLWTRGATVGIGGLGVGFSAWLLGAHDPVVAAVNVARTFVLAWPGAVCAACLDPARLADELGQRLRLPRRVAVSLGAAVQRFDRFGEVWAQLARVRLARGFGPDGPLDRVRYAASMCFSMLVATLRDAADSAMALQVRGLDAPGPSTWAVPPRWQRSDTAVLVGSALLAAIPYLVRALVHPLAG